MTQWTLDIEVHGISRTIRIVKDENFITTGHHIATIQGHVDNEDDLINAKLIVAAVNAVSNVK